MIQKILAVLLVAALLAAPVSASQYVKGSDTQIDDAIMMVEDFKRTYNDKNLWSQLRTFEVNDSKLYISFGKFVYDANSRQLISFYDPISLVDCNTGVMYNLLHKYDPRTNEITKMTRDELKYFGTEETRIVWDLHAAANEFGWQHTIRVINVALE